MAAESPRQKAPPAWHCLSAGEVASRLGTDPRRGLSEDEATERLGRFGPNALPDPERRSILRMVVDQFRDFMILVLVAAAIVSGMVGEPSDTIAIVVIVLLNAVIGFVQEFRAERAMAALKKMAAPLAQVRRAGLTGTLASEELVPGDVVLLEAGNVVPADLRLVDVAQLRVSEAALTGESEAVEKRLEALALPDAPIGDRRDMVYKGTIATYGHAAGIVVATGDGGQ